MAQTQGVHRGKVTNTAQNTADQARQSAQQTHELTREMNKMRLAASATQQTGLDAITHYGDSQALILPFYRTADGRLAKFSRPIYMRPEDRVKSQKMKQDRIRVYTPRLEMDDYTVERPAGCATAREALAQYKPYPVMYGERASSSRYPSKRINAKFTDLPGELRNRIYRQVLVLEQPVEFAPKADDEYTRRPAQDIAYQYRREVRGTLNIARVNKQINCETTDIFYGENEFRFTNALGWYVAHSFLTRIGRANVARLGRLTICVPWRGHIDETDSWDPFLAHGTNQGAYVRAAAVTKAGLPSKATVPLRFEQARLSCIEMLRACKDLRVLRFILPHAYFFEDVEPLPYRYEFSSGQVAGLAGRTQLVYLLKPFGDEGEIPVTRSLYLAEEKTKKKYTLEELAAKMGWHFTTAIDNWYGRYDVE